MAEVADNELNELRQAHALLKSMYADAGVGFDFRKLVKKKFPQADIPELTAIEKTTELGTELEKKMAAAETAFSKKIDDFLTARAKEKEDQQVESFAATVQRIAKDRGLTKEGVDKVLELQKETGVRNFEDAVVLFESKQPKAAPKPREFSSRMQFVIPEGKDDASFNKLMSDPEQWMQDEMLSVLAGAGEEE